MTKVSPLHILVTDLNHHVRSLLQRELAKEGHIVCTAGNRKEAYEAISGNNLLDILILDPELFEIFGESFFMEFRNRMAKATVIIHAFSDFIHSISNDANIKLKLVEKNEKSIDYLKTLVQDYSNKKI